MESDKLNHLPSKSREAALGFAEKLQKTFDKNLSSVILFGSASGAEFMEGKSDINILITLEKSCAADLNKIIDIAKEFIKKGLAIPLVFEKGHIASSLDTFPIEFSDMRQRHVLLYGADPLEQAQIETRNLRYQCERELKSIVVNLRRGYLQAGGKKENIRSLLEGSLSSVLAACRGMLYLAGKTPSDSAVTLIDEVEAQFNIKTDTIERVWQLKKAKDGGKTDLEALFDSYVREIADLATAVDKM